MNNNRMPNGVTVFPPWGVGQGTNIPPWINPFPPGGGPGPVVPPLPNFTNFPNLPGGSVQRLYVRIKSVFADSYIMRGNNNFLVATRRNPNNAQIFRLIILPSGQAKLRIQGGSFVRVDNRDFLVADTNNQGAAIFNIYTIGENEYVIRAQNGNFVRVRENDNRLVARAENPGPRTRFKFRQVQVY